MAEATPDTEAGPPSTRVAVAWAYALTVGRFATTAGVMFVLAALLTPREFGTMALAMVFVAFAQALMQHGPAQAVIQRKDVTDRHFDAAFWVTLGVGLLLAVSFAAIASLWATVNGLPALRAVCWALAPVIVIHALLVVPEAILRRGMRFRTLSVRVVFASLVAGLAGVAAAVAGWGVWALVIQQVLLTVISAIAIWAVTDWRPRLGSIRSALADLRHFSVHSVSEFISFFLSSRSDALFLGVFFGPVPIGLFRIAARLTDVVVEVSAGGLGQVTLPHLSRFSDDRAGLAAKLGRIVHAGAMLSLPAFGILFASAEHLLELLGPEWSAALPAVEILCVGGAFGVMATILGPAIQAAGRPGLSAALGWTRAAITTILLIVIGTTFASADPEEQVESIAILFVSLHVVFVVVSTIVIHRTVLHVPILPVLRPALPAFLSGVAAVVVGASVSTLTASYPALVALAITTTAAVIAAGVVLWAADAEAREAGRRIVRRLRQLRRG